MKKDNLKKENDLLTNDVLKVDDKNTKWECCKCHWIGKHSESGDKTIVLNDFWLLVCPVCKCKEFFKSEENNADSSDSNMIPL